MSELALRLVDMSDAYPRVKPLSDSVRVVHALPGRVRYHLPSWDGSRVSELESALLRVSGVVDAEASPVTRNVLVYFDLAENSEAEIRRAIESLAKGAPHVLGRPTRYRRRLSPVAAGSVPRPPMLTASTTSRSQRRLEILLGRPVAKLLPYVPKLLLLVFSLFTTRTPFGVTILSLEWYDLLTNLNAEFA